jgi:hypothetical protein
MNNNFDELILKRRARGRARTASMGAHVSWGAEGGRERLRGANWGRERGGANGHGVRGSRGPWGANVGARGPWGRVGRGAPTAEGRPRQRGAYVRAPRWRRVRGAHARGPRGSWGRVRTRPPMEARMPQVKRV